MPAPFLLHPADYPARLRELAPPPPCVWLSSPLPLAPFVAIVGTRKATPEAEEFAGELAREIVRAGGVVVSGGALGIDTAAHRGAVEAGGRTCVVLPTGPTGIYPKENAALFADVETRGGALLWPFPPGMGALPGNFLRRNGVLVALADAVVVAQAGVRSGALNAAACARKLRRPLFSIAAPPWVPGFEGSTSELHRGARAVVSIGQLLRELGLCRAQMSEPAEPAESARARTLPLPLAPPADSPPARSLSKDELAVLEALRGPPKHPDELCALTALPSASVSTALLTLSLEHVLVEGPGGLFRRNIP